MMIVSPARLAAASAALLLVVVSQNSAAAQDRRGALREACKADYQRLCSSVQPGGGRIVKCLQDQDEKLSEGCKTALAQRK